MRLLYGLDWLIALVLLGTLWPLAATANTAHTAPTSQSCVNTAVSLMADASFTSAALTWTNTGSDIGYYDFRIQYRTQGSTTWTTVPTLVSVYIDGLYNLTGLTPNTTYEWAVSRVCSTTDSSDPTASATFTTSCRPPVNPFGFVSLAYPSTTVGLNWKDTLQTGKYEVQWRKQGTTPWTSIAPVIPTSYTLTNLAINTAYEFQVRSVCSATINSSFAGPASFTTLGCVNGASALQSEPGYKSAALSWSSPSSFSTTYALRYRTQGSTAWTVASTTIQEGDYSSTYNLTGLAAKTAYEWAVSRVCSTTESSSYTNPVSFTTTCPPPVNPTAANPGLTSVQLDWEGPTGSPFLVRWRAQGSTTTPWTSISGITGTAYSLTSLSANTAYEWQVQTVCSTTESSSATLPMGFTTASCAAPVPLASTTYSATTKPLVWSSPGIGLQHTIQWRTQGSTTWTTVSNPVTTTYTPAVTIGYSLTGLTSGTAYEWRVSVACGGTLTSGYSSPASFTTASCSAPFLGENLYTVTSTSTTAQVSWSDQSAPAYQVRWRPQNSTVAWVTSTTVNAATYTIQGLNPYTTYEWQGRGICAGAGTTFSNPALFSTTGTPPPCPAITITQQPLATGTTIVGGTASASVTASSSLALTYQWYKNGDAPGNIQAGQTSRVLSLTNAQVSQAGTYSCLVSNSCSAVFSNGYTFAICQPVTISQQPPTSGTAAAGSTVSVSLVAAGSSTITYQWYKGGTASGNIVAGQTAPTLSLTNTQVSQTGSYSCLVSNSCSSTLSRGYSLTVINTCQPIAITQQPPVSATATVGSTVSVSVVATGTPPLTYQWYKAGTAAGNIVAGQTAATLSLTNVQVSQAGSYSCLITNSCDTEWSNGFTLALCQPVAITQQPPAAATATVGSTVSASLVATGSPTLTYQWYKASTAAGNAVAGQTSATLSLTNVQVSQSATYYAVVSNSCSSTVSNGFALSVSVACQPVAITQQPPATGTATVGTTVSVSLVATGSGPITYQWYKGTTAAGNVVAGQPSAALSLTNVQASQAGTYIAVVTNSCGTTMSTGFVLTVNTAPCNGGFYTVQNGSWNNSAIWSCGQIPTAADAVEIRHAVTIPTPPTNYLALARRITFTSTGKLTFGSLARLKTGP